MKTKECPKCGADISDSFESAEPDVGIMSAGWYCEACNLCVPYEYDDEPDYDAKSFRETYIEAWNEHRRLHRR